MSRNQVVVITGAGSGLGREMVKSFCGTGAKVVGFGRNIESLQNSKPDIENAVYDFVAVDVSDHAAVEQAISKVLDIHDRIDVLINNAAIYPKVSFLDESSASWEYAVGVNINGVAFCCKSVLPVMIRQNYGRIYNVSSWAHLNPIANSAAYSCGKGGVHSLTMAIAADLRALNKDVTVHEWIPGHLNTQMSEYTGMDPAIAAAWAVDIVNQTSGENSHGIFQENQEWHPPLGLKSKIKSKLLFWKK